MQPPQPRVGLYAWGGPNTVDLLKVKYIRPRINEESFLSLYDTDALDAAQGKLGVTDLWMTYSWGFSDAHEEKQYEFVRERLSLIKARGITTYGYVQGLNVVYRDFENEDFFCRTPRGKRIAYSRGRYLICPSHPRTKDLLVRRVSQAAGEAFDAVYVDNLLYGLMPFTVSENMTATFGCHCSFCKEAFQKQHHYALPTRAESREELADITTFRAAQIETLVALLAEAVYARGKQFGVNLFDPFWHTTEIYFGYSLDTIKPYLDYYLIENHALSKDGKGIYNAHVSALLNDGKPTFILSYRNGIGIEPMYSQETLEQIFAEARTLGYHACIKGSEFTTKRMWHAFDFEAIEKVGLTERRTPLIEQIIHAKPLVRRRLATRMLIRVLDPFMPFFHNLVYHSSVLWYLFVKTGLYTRALRAQRVFAIEEPRDDATDSKAER